ncbi:MAG: hypothetical protein K5859_08590 [Atopobiaceae bacterium]|nr:hypothetical protein [Atopobiaceae bacterium]
MAAERTDKGRRSSKTQTIAIDVALAVAATLLMMRAQLPAMLHQVAGIVFGVLTAVHLWQHRAWLGALVHGKLKGRHIMSAIGMAAILVCTAALIVSGLMMSTWATDLGIAAGTGGARGLHLPLSHLLYCLVGAHAGLCMKGVRKLPRPALIAWIIAAAAGIWSFIALDFGGYITGATAFAFIDPTKPVVLSFAQFASIFALFALAGVALNEIARTT